MRSATVGNFRLTRVLLAAAALAFVWFVAQMFFGASAAHADDGDEVDSTSVTDIVSDVTSAVKDEVTEPVTDAVDSTTSGVVDLVTDVTDAVQPPAEKPADPPQTAQESAAKTVPAQASSANSAAEPTTQPSGNEQAAEPDSAESASDVPAQTSTKPSASSAEPDGSAEPDDSTGPLSDIVGSTTDALAAAVTDTPVENAVSPIAQDLDEAIDPLIASLPLVGDDLSRLVGTDLVATTTGAVSDIADPLVVDLVSTVRGTTAAATNTVDGAVVGIGDTVADTVDQTSGLEPPSELQPAGAKGDSVSTSAQIGEDLTHTGPRDVNALEAALPIAQSVEKTGPVDAALAPTHAPMLPSAPNAAIGASAAVTGSASGAGSVAAERAVDGAGAASDSIRSELIDDDDLPESLTLTLTCSPD
ncbi:hypothetical protein [Paramicrobacterium agarici]|uniref:hypothetical protein n=1 Tax=Paramicrobacterium agarici TaxID=630514 RepID=UPI001152FD42|nr:hypothetical protein [Microbacterium agarici]TQO23128.1 hypothetical protein FB385_1974 [Microbacterium agarici]